MTNDEWQAQISDLLRSFGPSPIPSSLVIRISSLKKIPPPTSDGCEGRLFPPEHSWKAALLVIEFPPGSKPNFAEIIEKRLRFVQCNNCASRSPLVPSLRDVVSGVLVWYA